jgi:hypothetical protein
MLNIEAAGTVRSVMTLEDRTFCGACLGDPFQIPGPLDFGVVGHAQGNRRVSRFRVPVFARFQAVGIHKVKDSRYICRSKFAGNVDKDIPGGRSCYVCLAGCRMDLKWAECHQQGKHDKDQKQGES